MNDPAAGKAATQSSDAATTDVRMMTVAHSSYRREIGLSPQLVRHVPVGDAARINTVADHVTLCLTMLAHHHALEAEMLWPALIERLPQQLAPVVRLVQSQQSADADLIIQARAQVAAWRTRAASEAAGAAALSQTLAELSANLADHFDAEETHLLPLLGRVITRGEWATFTRRGTEPIAAGLLPTALGMLLYEGDPDLVASELKQFPGPLRRLLTAQANRSFRQYATKIHGTATPPRGGGRRP